MEILEFIPKKLKQERLPWKTMLLVPIGDIQFGAQGCWTDGFKRWHEESFAKAEQLEADIYFFGMGDYVDMLSPSNRKKWDRAELYEIALDSLEEVAERHLEGVLELLQGTEGRWLGMLEGHHYFEFDDGTTTDTRLCQALNATFLGDCAQVHLRFIRDESVSSTVRVWGHHGVGTGSPNTKLEKQAAKRDADILLMGHTPTIEHKKIPYMYTTDYDPPILKHKSRHVVGTGGWLRGYTQGSMRRRRAQGNYVEQAMMEPAPLGGVRILLTPQRQNGENLVHIEVTA